MKATISKMRILGVIGIAAGLSLAACANRPHKAEDNSMKSASRAAAAVGANRYVMVEFDKGQTGLTEASKASLRTLASQAPESAIDEVKVLAWADREYPADGTKATSADISMADRRAEAVEKYIKSDLGYRVDVDNHNMAKRPAALSEVFRTDDAKVKNSIEASGAVPTTPGGNESIFVGDKASKVLVLVKYDEE